MSSQSEDRANNGFCGRKRGRPKSTVPIEAIVALRKLKTEDGKPWGFIRIALSLTDQGYYIGATTVRRMLREDGALKS